LSKGNGDVIMIRSGDEAIDRQLSDAGFDAFENPLGRGA